MKFQLLTCAAAMLLATSYTIAWSAPNDGNVWDWRDHQPTRAQTVQKEKAAGVEPTKSERKPGAITDNRLNQQLQKAPGHVEDPQQGPVPTALPPRAVRRRSIMSGPDPT